MAFCDQSDFWPELLSTCPWCEYDKRVSRELVFGRNF